MSEHKNQMHRRERLVSFAHYLTAFVLALEGVSHLEHRPIPWLFVVLCWFAAAAVVAVTLAHRRIEMHFPALQAVIHLAEGAVSAALVYLTHHEGKVGLPFAWGAAAIVLFTRAAWEFRPLFVPHHFSRVAAAPGEGTESDA